MLPDGDIIIFRLHSDDIHFRVLFVVDIILVQVEGVAAI